MKDGELRFLWKLGDVENTPLSFKEECKRAAKLIYEQFNKEPVWVTLSGGFDSETVARSFLEAEVPFRVAITKFSDDLNQHDIKGAIEFCQKYKLEYKVFELNVFEFYAKGLHLGYAKRYKCNSPQLATHFWLAEQIDGPFVFSGTPMQLIWQGAFFFSKEVVTDLGKFYPIEAPPENQITMDRLILDKGLQGIYNFFLYTPELILSSCMSVNPFYVSYIYFYYLQKYKKDFSCSYSDMFMHREVVNLIKYYMLMREGFDVKMRNKMSGFELLHKKLAATVEKTELDQQFVGMEHFNKLYRAPMQAIAQQSKVVEIQFGEKNKKIVKDKVGGWLTNQGNLRKWLKEYNKRPYEI